MEKQCMGIGEKNKIRYGSFANMAEKYDRYARRDAFFSRDRMKLSREMKEEFALEEFLVWRGQAKEKLHELIGLSWMESCDLQPALLEREELPEGIVREKWEIQTEPEVWMPFYVLLPPFEKRANSKSKKYTCFLAPCGHQGGGKESIAGVVKNQAIEGAIKRFQYDYGLEIAKRGFVAICPDLRGFGERRDDPFDESREEEFLKCSCYQLSHMALPMGETVVGMNTWDMMRLIDYVETREEFRMDNLGCIGFSGGGMQTLWLAALDERIKQIFISGYFYGFKDSLLELNGNCNCNYVPHLFEHFDCCDLAGLLAPRPLVIQTSREDHLNGKRGLDNVFEQVEITKKAYELYEKPDQLMVDVNEGGHCFHKENLQHLLRCLGNEL